MDNRCVLHMMNFVTDQVIKPCQHLGGLGGESILKPGSQQTVIAR